MEITDGVLEYLEGKNFSTGARFKITYPEKKLQDRISLILDIVKGKRIIDLGCTDHLEIIDSKLLSNTWLHKRVCEVASLCIGIDVNREAVEYVRSRGYQDVFSYDILEDKDLILRYNQHYDILLAGEVIEHLDNPILFLSMLRESYKDNVDYLLVTAPNAFSGWNFIYTFKGQEVINTDHRYYFTFYTLAKILTLSGFKPIEFWLVNSAKPRKFYSKLLFTYLPGFRSKIIMLSSFKGV